MTQGTKIAWDDTVLPFQLDDVDMRGRVARLDGVLEGILKQHDYPPQVVDRIDRSDDQTALETVATGAIQRCRSDDRD